LSTSSAGKYAEASSRISLSLRGLLDGTVVVVVGGSVVVVGGSVVVVVGGAVVVVAWGEVVVVTRAAVVVVVGAFVVVVVDGGRRSSSAKEATVSSVAGSSTSVAIPDSAGTVVWS
jgi:hypothetical protein